jgi:hypothetical protein
MWECLPKLLSVKKVTVFVPDNHFWPSLIFALQVQEPTLRMEHWMRLHSGRLYLYLQILDLAVKG